MVRNKIKMFAQKKATLPPGRHKIVILDEADRSAEPDHCLTSLTSLSVHRTRRCRLILR